MVHVPTDNKGLHQFQYFICFSASFEPVDMKMAKQPHYRPGQAHNVLKI
jgi:hypothetical protein